MPSTSTPPWPGNGCSQRRSACGGLQRFGILLAPAEHRRLAACSWLASVAVRLSPALNLAPQLAPLADQYLLWALPFLLLAIALAVEGLLARWRTIPVTFMPVVVGGSALALALLTVAQSSSFASKQRLFLVATRHQPGCGQNWAHFAIDSIEARTDPLDPRPGDSALRALACVDGRRIIDIVRAPLVVEACALLRRHRHLAEAETLLQEQLPLLPDIGVFRLLLRAEVELRLGNGSAALSSIGDLVPPEVAAAAADLADRCQDGVPLPDQLPPARTFISAGQEQYDGERWRQRWTCARCGPRGAPASWCIAIAKPSAWLPWPSTCRRTTRSRVSCSPPSTRRAAKGMPHVACVPGSMPAKSCPGHPAHPLPRPHREADASKRRA